MLKKRNSKKSNPKNSFQTAKPEEVKGLIATLDTTRNKEEQTHLLENTCEQSTKNFGVLLKKKNKKLV